MYMYINILILKYNVHTPIYKVFLFLLPNSKPQSNNVRSPSIVPWSCLNKFIYTPICDQSLVSKALYHQLTTPATPLSWLCLHTPSLQDSPYRFHTLNLIVLYISNKSRLGPPPPALFPTELQIRWSDR